MRRASRCLLALLFCLTLQASFSAAAQADPTLGLVATNAEIGDDVHATATLAEGTEPTGLITFEAFGPGDLACAGPAVFTDSATVDGNGEYSSGDFSPSTAGTYRWSAGYGGDIDNVAAESLCSAESSIEEALPTLSTTATSATIGSAIADSATLSAGFSPTGQITFKAFGPDDATCAEAAAFEATVPVSGNGNYGSGNFNPTSAGAYRWTASYPGDANNAAATSACNAANETSTVAKATPGLSTTATSATVGSAISDSASLSAGFSPTGQITFKAFGPDDATCASAVAFEATVPVSGNGNYGSGNYTTSAAGTYRWTASYSGDANNAAATSACNAANETSTVAKASPGLTTTATNATVGSAISDSGALAGGVSPTGQITFKAFGPNNATCTGTPAFEATVAVSGNGNYGSGGFAAGAAGTYRWTAAYSGDTNNNAATSSCNAANETSTVAKASPALVTTAANATVGSPISDSGTLSAGFSPSGQIVFKAFGPSDTTCTGTPVFEVSVSVSDNGVYGSGNFTPTGAGAYRWTAAYSGDANNAAATSACNAANETSTVAKASPALATTATSAPFGFPIADSATLSAGFSPTGSITFKAFGPNDTTCANAAAFQATVSVDKGNNSYASGPFNSALLGTYRWTAAYSGDANNPAATSGCNAPNETSTVGPASPALATTPANATIGSPISDSATISGGFSPTGSITFKAFGPTDPNCLGTPAFTAAVTVNGNGTYTSGPFTPTQLGNYKWSVSYPGDANNNAVESACNSVNVSTVSKFAPTLTPSAANATIGSSIAEIASFSGGSNRTGEVVFRAYGPADATCTGAPVFAATVEVTPGNGTYASGAFAPAQVGSYRWTASYSGDSINAPTATACNAANSVSTVAQATPAIATKASAASLPIGTAVRDTATIAGGHQPSGTVTFRLYGPSDANCSSQPVFTDVVPVAGNAAYASGGFAPAQPGQYFFTASYSGDVGNNATASLCNAAGASVVVKKRTPSLSARASLRGTNRIAARATLAAAAAPKGKILFQLFGPDNPRCAGKPAFSERVTVHGGGSYQPSVFRARARGVYRLVVSYAGDAWNKSARSGCNKSGQSVRVGSR